MNSKNVAGKEHGESVHTPLKTHPRTLLCCKLLSPAPPGVYLAGAKIPPDNV
jgi:hypothetical protein